MTKSILVIAGMAGGLVSLQASPLISDQLTVYDSTQTIIAQLTVYEDGTFTGPGGCVPQQGNGLCTAGTTEAGNIYFLSSAAFADPNKFFTPTGLWETNPNQISDLFGVFHISGAYVLGFESDDESGNAQAGIINMQEPANGIVSATQYLPSTSGYTATFYSDAPTPEPGTLVLLGLGLTAVLWGGRNQLRRSA